MFQLSILAFFTIICTSAIDFDFDYNIIAYIDNGIIEIFINGGEYVITNATHNVKNYIKVQNIDKSDIYN